MERVSRGHVRADIQGLRAIAVVLVVCQHAWGWPSGGFIGVDVFFVISGFVITVSLERELRRDGTLSLRSFFLRRIRRLLPAAVVVAVVTVGAAAAVFYLPRLLGAAWDAGAAVASSENWRLVRLGTDYFAERGTVSLFQHYWSLSVEEQFYALWPVALILLWRFARRRSTLVLLVAIGTAVSFGVSVVETALRPGWAYFTIESRAWELGVGALIALAFGTRTVATTARRRAGLAAVGAAMILASALALTGDAAFPGPLALGPVAGAALLIVAGAGADSDGWRAPLTSRPARYVGDISYSLYLWHFPAIVFVAAMIPQPVIAGSIAIVASFVLAAASYRWVEQPFRQQRREARETTGSRTLSNALWGGTAIILVIVLAVVQLRGPDSILEPPALGGDHEQRAAFADTDDVERAVATAAAATAWPTAVESELDRLSRDAGAAASAQSDRCITDVFTAAGAVGRNARACTVGSGARTAVVFGDSIATSWLPAVRSALDPNAWRVVGIGFESCPPSAVTVLDRSGRADFADACDAARFEAIAQIERLAPDLVIISNALGSFERLVADDRENVWRLATQATIGRLIAGGADVAILESPPETAAPLACANRLTGPASCLRAPSEEWSQKSEAEATAARTTGALFVSTRGWFCDPDLACPAFVDDTLVTTDGGHLTTAYSERLGLVLRDALSAAAP